MGAARQRIASVRLFCGLPRSLSQTSNCAVSRPPPGLTRAVIKASAVPTTRQKPLPELSANTLANTLSPLKLSTPSWIDSFSGDSVFANVFADNSGRGFCLVVGTADAFMTARVNPGGGRETAQFEVCDNDRGKPQNSRTDAMRWRAAPIHSGETRPTGDTG